MTYLAGGLSRDVALANMKVGMDPTLGRAGTLVASVWSRQLEELGPGVGVLVRLGRQVVGSAGKNQTAAPDLQGDKDFRGSRHGCR